MDVTEWPRCGVARIPITSSFPSADLIAGSYTAGTARHELSVLRRFFLDMIHHQHDPRILLRFHPESQLLLDCVL